MLHTFAPILLDVRSRIGLPDAYIYTFSWYLQDLITYVGVFFFQEFGVCLKPAPLKILMEKMEFDEVIIYEFSL